MKSLFPYTPTMRYERMFVAAVAGAIAGAVGFGFLLSAIHAAESLTWVQLQHLGGVWRQALTLSLLAGSSLALSMSLLLSALIKVHVPQMERFFGIYVVVHWIALRLLLVACALGLAFVALQVVAVVLHEA